MVAVRMRPLSGVIYESQNMTSDIQASKEYSFIYPKWTLFFLNVK